MRPISEITKTGAETQEEAIYYAKYLKKKRHRCLTCRKLSYYTHSINSGPWVCYDGCFSTNGTDNRSKNGEPLWLDGNEAKGEIEFGILK